MTKQISESASAPDGSPKETVLLELLKEKLLESRELMLHYQKAGIVYLAITSALATPSENSSEQRPLGKRPAL